MGATLAWEQTALFEDALGLSMAFQHGEVDLFREGRVRVGWDEHGLRVHAKLVDDSVFSGSTGDGQPTWRLGDVFEIFAKLTDREDYFELHMTPNGHRLQLHFPDQSVIGQIRDGAMALEEMMVDEPVFDFLTRKTAHGWEVLALVPTATLEAERESLAGCELAVSFSRYDYADAESEPILSSTTRHEELNFHRLHEWTVLEFEG